MCANSVRRLSMRFWKRASTPNRSPRKNIAACGRKGGPMPVTLSASAICKWILSRGREPDSAQAFELAQSLKPGESSVLQPVHCVAEVPGVRVRWTLDQHSLQIERVLGCDRRSLTARMFTAWLTVWRRSMARICSIGFYYAIAIQTGGTLITADERYHRPAQVNGSIVPLKD
jgi:hypothetical protein